MKLTASFSRALARSRPPLFPPQVTQKQPDQIEAPSRDGAFIHGLTLEGCRWDDKAGVLDDSKPKELFCPMPVILVRAVTVDKVSPKSLLRVEKLTGMYWMNAYHVTVQTFLI